MVGSLVVEWLGVLASSLVDRGFIGGTMVSVLASSPIDRGFIGGEAPLTITPPMNPRSTRLETSTPNHYTTDEPKIYQTRDKHANHYTTDEHTIYRTRDEHA
jgi:hypothetical protein